MLLLVKLLLLTLDGGLTGQNILDQIGLGLADFGVRVGAKASRAGFDLCAGNTLGTVIRRNRNLFLLLPAVSPTSGDISAASLASSTETQPSSASLSLLVLLLESLTEGMFSAAAACATETRGCAAVSVLLSFMCPAMVWIFIARRRVIRLDEICTSFPNDKRGISITTYDISS
ncbi:hypothetical protein [Acetobacter lovaniensis]|uniref:Uncharacterized protein n=1 Tax=Acetobacter lovaniensis TaxID=104100 RepID=A0A841QF80_9PROT|nr:hypothetical protein [Acetobacter lovaniensis]MBB6457130.1 hypothetical protein [Acetobacter lovaniensis]NHN81288.1 hypothetical protein [Acetobacter lovaniensis]